LNSKKKEAEKKKENELEDSYSEWYYFRFVNSDVFGL